MNHSAKAWRSATLAIALGGSVALGATAWSATASGAATSAPACRTSQLTVWRGAPGSGVTGGVYYDLQLSNTSTMACALDGFPGASALSSARQQLGSAASWDHTKSPARVVLTPGTTAHAVLRITDVSVFSPTTCKPVVAAGLKIYPPNETSAAFLPFQFRACANKGPIYLSVRAIASRAGIPGYSQ